MVGLYGDALKITVGASPVGGRANRAVIELVATALGLDAGKVEIVGGHVSRHKRVLIRDVEPELVRTRLRSALSSD